MSKFENGKIILENGEVIHPTKKQEWFEQILEYKDSIFVETRNNVYKINIKTKEQLDLDMSGLKNAYVNDRFIYTLHEEGCGSDAYVKVDHITGKEILYSRDFYRYKNQLFMIHPECIYVLNLDSPNIQESKYLLESL